MSQQRHQQSRSSSSHRSRSARSDHRASITAAQFEALNISSHTPPPSITVHRTPEYLSSDLSGFDTNLGVPVSQEQQNWPPLQMTAAVDSQTATLPFGAGVSNPEISYSDFQMRQQQYPGDTMSGSYDYNIPPHSSAYTQQNYYYAGHAHPQLSDYGAGSVPVMPQGYHGNFEGQISPPHGAMLPDTSINMPPTESHPYSLQPPQIPSTRQQRHRRSLTPTGHDVHVNVQRPSSRQDEYLQHGFASHSAPESYPSISPGTPSLTPDYMNRSAPSVSSHHGYPTSPSLYDPLNPYQGARQYSFSPVSDTGIPVTSPPADGFASPYSVSPAPEDQVRVVNSRPKPQCWDHGCNGREFSTFSNLLRHQRERAGTATKSECPHCGTVFTRTTARNGHLAQGKCKAKREQQAQQQQQQQ
ncbi:hypothetical protein AJ79_00008 [Helicocarpus griseus UAMH5409]|uniref:C2H2-type domain-containing protein n=1 Tax=Helicocarpus griseus UAMH5409 TaxID=1447875 RepID=A0A2B7YCI1_9EURO|nr:hypothetical protein AJ79_00008 [Helicocarpus griseus UAMH5409]